MEKIVAEITYTGNNYCAYIPELSGVCSVGKTLEEIISNIESATRFHLEGMREDDDVIPPRFKGDYCLEYKLSSEALLHAFSGIFTKAALSKITGINQRQLWHYEAGIRKPRAAQRKRIEEGLHKLANQLLSISL